MLHYNFYESRLKGWGYPNPTQRQVEISSVLDHKQYDKLAEVGFNVAYSQRLLNISPMEGSYQRDMLYYQRI